MEALPLYDEGADEVGGIGRALPARMTACTLLTVLFQVPLRAEREEVRAFRPVLEDFYPGGHAFDVRWDTPHMDFIFDN